MQALRPMPKLKKNRWHSYIWSDGQLNLRAMSLVFTTILSIVPLLAVSFSVLKAFGVHGQMEPVLLAIFTQLGDRGPEISAMIIGFVDNVEVGLLGAVGIAVLFYSVISLLQKIEEAFNYTWYVGRLRALNERISRYLSVVLVGPVLVFAGLALTAKLLNNTVTQSVNGFSVMSEALQLWANAIPYVFVIAAFTFTYYFVPNTKVQFRAALVGGLVAGVLWQSMGWLYAFSIANASAQVAIYAGFAALFFFMFWTIFSSMVFICFSSFSCF